MVMAVVWAMVVMAMDMDMAQVTTDTAILAMVMAVWDTEEDTTEVLDTEGHMVDTHPHTMVAITVDMVLTTRSKLYTH